MKAWVVVDIGCIECGDTNDLPVVGIYLTKESAQAKVQELRRDLNGYSGTVRDEHGGFSTTDWHVRLQAAEVQR